MTRHQIFKFAMPFYGLMSLAAFVWGALTGRAQILWTPKGSSWISAARGTLAGTLFGITIIVASRLMGRFGWAKRLSAWFTSILPPLRWRDAFILAALSSCAEEFFFRGALLPTLGVGLSTLLFAIVHLPPRRDLWPWTVSAGFLGYIFALGTQWTGNLAAPIAAHFLINFINLKHLSPPLNNYGISPQVAKY